MPERALSRPVAVLAGAYATVALLLLVQWGAVRSGVWVDLDVYVMGGRAVLDRADLYGAVSAEGFRFTYPPFAAAAFVPLAMVPTDVARLVFLGASVACLVAALAVVARRLALTPAWTVWLVLAALALEPVLRTLLLGQVNAVLLLMVVLDVLVLKHGRGLLVGCAAGIKLTPAAFVLVFLVERDVRSCARAAAGFLTTVAVGFAVDPAASAQYWSGGFVGLAKFGDDATLGTDNQSLLGAWLRLGHVATVPLALQLLLTVIGVGVGVVVAALAVRRDGPHSRVVALAAVAIGALLGSPVSWSHHWLWVTVAIALAVAVGRLGVAIGTTVLFWSPVVWVTYTDQDFGELSFPWWWALLSAAYVLAGLLLLAWLHRADRATCTTRAGWPTASQKELPHQNRSSDPQDRRLPENRG